MRKATNRDNNSRFITLPMAKERYNLGNKLTYELAEKSGALIRFGRTVRFDAEKMDRYFSEQCGK
ncbi:MAG: DUF6462 family protein [Lachnospiraceae bacterium]